MADGKNVETVSSIPVTVPDSPVEQQESVPDTTTNDEAEGPDELDFSSDVERGNLDWPELVKVEEVPQETVDEATEQIQAGEQPAPVENDLTDGMKNRISKLKQKEAEKIAGKDEQIRLRDAQIQKLQQMTSEYATLQSQFRPNAGNADDLKAEIAKLDEQLEDEGDVMTPAEIHRLGRRQSQLENQLRDVAQQAVNAENLGKQHTLMRQQSDAYVQENYPFVKDQNDEYYGVLKNQAYPMLEQLVPNFQNHPHDMALAAELTKMMVNSHKYEQMLGNNPAPRPQPQPMAGNVTPQQTRQQQQMNPRKMVANARGGDTESWAKVLNRMGHSWNPEQNMK